MPKQEKSTSFDVNKLYSQVEGIITNKATGRRFEKGKLLGKGRNGCCFKVHDMESNETFACKVLKKSRHSLYEAKMLKSLNHRNIVKYYEHFCDEKVQYIIMECCDSSLYDICLEKEIDVNLIRYYVRQIATACHYLHTEKYIVHADLKPENILLKDGVVKLADFGLSRKLSSVNEKLTHKGGTLVFKAPEIIIKKLCGVENDCWALGCTIFQLFEEKKIDVNLIRYYVRQIATACHYLHTEKYIVHADLKPGNILLKDGVVKLADFGSSRKMSSVNEKLTHKGGTLVYKAPEIILKQLCGVEIDCWALGCTIFKLFEGKAVFTRKKAKKIEHIFINDTFKVPLTSCSNANTLITRLLETNPELRYTMKDVLKSTFVKEPSQCTVMVKKFLNW
ncbi:PLK2 [Cordylochernes scorpioides]|uniref:PLK2 n=1 Tax=Cordylochernes scorpioides TaxID=51811 RepID=A0ABY6L6I1_9ARAC|nr:PLK2 [Cordylochernes scorpioides]